MAVTTVVDRLAAIIGRGKAGRALARRLARQGVRSRAALRRPEILAQLPRESRARVLFAPQMSVLLETALAVSSELCRRLVDGGRPVRAVAVGGVRRGKARVKDIDVLVITSAPGASLSDITLRPARAGDRLSIADTYSSGPRRRSLIAAAATRGKKLNYYHIDLFLATPAEEPFALFHHTGSAQYNIRTRAHAKRRGWRLNQYGLFSQATGRPVAAAARVKTERDLAALLGVTYRPPAARER